MMEAAGAVQRDERHEAFRGDLLAHCYRMLGSLEEAEEPGHPLAAALPGLPAADAVLEMPPVNLWLADPRVFVLFRPALPVPGHR